MGDPSPLSDEMLEELYGWIDKVPLSRPKKDLRRDFSDGVLCAEVIKFYIPRLIEMHNYPAANKTDRKMVNWKLLNKKAFKKLGFEIADDVIRNVCNCRPWAAEQLLVLLQRKIDQFQYEEKRNTNSQAKTVSKSEMESVALNDQPEADQIHSPSFPKGKGHKSQSMDSMKKLNVHGEVVPKLLVEEKEQELLAKEETIQILNAKVRRLEHLLHLKDIRIDDLQGRLERLELHP